MTQEPTPRSEIQAKAGGPITFAAPDVETILSALLWARFKAEEAGEACRRLADAERLTPEARAKYGRDADYFAGYLRCAAELEKRIRAARPGANEQSPMSCPRACGVDVRDHHSSAKVKGGCDTGPMSLEDMSAWFAARGAGRPGFHTVAELVEEHYGKSEDQLSEMYDAMCGSMA